MLKLQYIALGLLLPVTVLANVQVVNSQEPVATTMQMVKVPDKNNGTDLLTQVKMLKQSVQDLHTLVEAQGREIDLLKSGNQATSSTVVNMQPVQAAQPASPTAQPTQSVTAAQPVVQQTQTENQAINPNEVDSYQAAVSLIKQKQYGDAITHFVDYLKAYPAGKYTPNAYYWLGQLYMVSGENAKAKESFQTVVDRFPTSVKAPEAMYHLGMISYNRLNFDDAKSWWNKLVGQFPHSTAARLATQRLDALKKEGY